MNNPHIFDPKRIEILESEDRKTWQNRYEIIKKLDLQSNQIVADLGCGNGYFSIPISKQVRKVYSIDIQEEMIKALEKKLFEQNILNIDPLLSKESKIPLNDESIDLVLSINTLHEFQQKQKMVKEIRRILKPNKKVAIVDFKKKKNNFGPPISIRISKDQAISLFENISFFTLKIYNLKYHYMIIFQKK
jgi:ubiquinone/menaquinone biosynthesis C-methylase UbiE